MTLKIETLDTSSGGDRLAAIDAEIKRRKVVTQALFREGKFDAMHSNQVEIERLRRERLSLRKPRARSLPLA